MASTPADAASLEAFLAHEIRSRSHEVTLEWIEHLQDRLSIRPARLLPTAALKDHVPRLVEDIADRLAVEGRPLAPEIIVNLRLYADLRREQGYDVSEILAELGILTHLLSDELKDALERFSGATEPLEAVVVTGRFHETMREVDRIVVGLYREGEVDERHDLSQRLADFAETLAHELKNPLNAAVQSARLLEDEEEIEVDQKKKLRRIMVRSLDRIDDLLYDMLTLTDAEAARSREGWISLPEVVAAVFDQLAELARKNDVALEVEDELPDITVEASRIEIALHNLVLNAIKYADPDKEERWVKLSGCHLEESDRRAGGWRISVADNGLGIPKSFHDRIFQRHVRAHPTVADGTGLGLGISRAVVGRRGGRIRFESEEGQGSTFHVILPDRRGGTEEERRGGRRGERSPRKDHRRRR